VIREARDLDLRLLVLGDVVGKGEDAPLAVEVDDLRRDEDVADLPRPGS